MAAPIRPPSTKAFGREKWLWVPAIASVLGIPAIAEINAAAGLDLSCMLFDGTGKPVKNTNLVDRQRRLCDTATYQQVGTTSYAGGEMLAAFDQQGAAASNGVKAWEKFPEGTAGFLVRRLGILVVTDFAVGQFVDTFPVEFGPPFPIIQGEGEGAEVGFSSTFAITGPVATKVAITA